MNRKKGDPAELGAAVRKRLRYDERTGLLHWRTAKREDFATLNAFMSWRARCEGKPITSTRKDGYVTVAMRVDGRSEKFLAHRVAWFLHTGEWPKGQIDHINGDRSDNRIANLRDVTAAINRRNMRCRSGGSTGVMGVSWSKHAKRWLVRIAHQGTQKNLGYYLDFDEAVRVRRAAEEEFGYHKNHGERAKPPIAETTKYIAEQEASRIRHAASSAFNRLAVLSRAKKRHLALVVDSEKQTNWARQA